MKTTNKTRRRCNICDRWQKVDKPICAECEKYLRDSIAAGTVVVAELISASGQFSQCWIEVALGLRIKTSIPSEKLRGLELREGDEFLWSPKSGRTFTKPTDDDLAEREQLDEDISELQREFREELKQLDTGLATD